MPHWCMPQLPRLILGIKRGLARKGTRYRLMAWALAIAMLLATWPLLPAEAQSPPFRVEAAGAVLMDARSGEVLFAQDETRRWVPASLVKLMTLRLAFQDLRSGKIKPETPVTVSEKAWRTGGSRMFLDVGDRVAVSDILRGVAVASGNDATVALAELLGGAEEAFVARMNEEAARLGLSETRFVDSSGLAMEGQFMSALDAARLARAYISDFPEALQIHSMVEFTYGGIRQFNRNGLLRTYEGADGLKTGHVEESGYNLIATAHRQGTRLIAVVMGTASEKSREQEAAKLLNFGFANFETVLVAGQGEPVASLRVYKGTANRVNLVPTEEVAATVPRGQKDVATRVEAPPSAVAPLEAGQQLGEMVVLKGDRELKRVPLVAAEAVPRGGFFKVLLDSVLIFLARVFRRG